LSLKIGPYDADQITAVLEMWDIYRPIDVAAFLRRLDVPEDSKDRVRVAGLNPVPISRDPVDSYRRMQTQIVFEVVRLDEQRWRPLG
jgi:hypothetical protein